ncbi:MAG: YqcC family protein [Gammaproteobacteria bacterium]|nr:YqcC family protein [Gammaproteobacteria bacterium]
MALAELTLMLEKELREQHLWHSKPPAAPALASPQPFCFDTLEFPQWLQWVYLPQLKTLIERGDYLPKESDIAEYAEQALETTPDADKLVMILHAIDEAFHDNAAHSPPLH